MSVVWQDPPNPGRGGGPRSARINTIVKQLQAQPGRWALVGEIGGFASATVWKQRGCEVTIRRIPDSRRYNLYARWPTS